MIQRIQTLYLFLAVVAGILLFFFPIATFYNDLTGNYRFLITGVESMDPTPKINFSFWFTSPLWFINGVMIILTLITIFLYKNRILQMRMVAFDILCNILIIVMVFFFYTNKIEEYTQIEASFRHIGVVFPLLSLIFLVLANQGIRKDISKVKAADRLR